MIQDFGKPLEDAQNCTMSVDLPTISFVLVNQTKAQANKLNCTEIGKIIMKGSANSAKKHFF